MEFARPGAAFLLLLLPALVLLHLRGGRRAARVVPSLALWRDVPDDARGSTAARRPPMTLSLLLQALALIAATVAIMAPGSAARGDASRRVVLVVDVSASMGATDVEPSRLAAANAAARSVLDAAPRGTRAALILAGDDPRLAAGFTGEFALLRSALPAVASDSGADIAAALSLARAVAGGSGALVHVFTDGDGIAAEEGVRVSRFHGGGSNVGLSDLAVSRGSEGGYSASLRVSNHGGALARVPIVLTMAGGVPQAKAVSVGPGSSADVTFHGSAPSTEDVAVTAHTTRADDLRADNFAYAVLPARRPMEVVVVGERSRALASVLSLDPLANVVVVARSEYLPRDGVALTVFRGWTPRELPRGDVVILGPAPSSPHAPTSRARDTRFLGVDTHPLLRLVDVASVTAADVGVYDARTGPLGDAEGLMRTPEGPAAVLSETDGGRVLVVGFDPFDLSATDMSLQPALVVFFANVLEAARARVRVVPVAVAAGRAMPGMPMPGTTVVGPTEDTSDGGPSILRAGIHTATTFGRPVELVAANIPPAESDLRRWAGATAPPAEHPAGGASGSHWRWYALAAVCLISAEWATYHRRRAAA